MERCMALGSILLPFRESGPPASFLSNPLRSRKPAVHRNAWKSTHGSAFHWTARANLPGDDRLAGMLFGSSEGLQWWDERCLFHPIVVKDPSSAMWKMYYYGRDRDSWHCGVSPALISTGRIGMATSFDGVNWSKFLGPLPNGAIMDPNEGCPSSFDCVHIGCSDVFFHEGRWWMYYFGGDMEKLSFSPAAEKSIIGLRMRTGLARSVDGVVFERFKEPVLDVGSKGDWDGLLVAWAKVIPPSLPSAPVSDSASCRTAPWLMTYSSMEINPSPPHFAIGVAISDDGERWTKLGKVLERGAPGAWDEGGVGRRHVVKVSGLYFMFYEGVDSHGMHGIGLAVSKDGLRWEKDREAGNEPGGPIFTARKGEDSWDSGGVAAPHVVRLKDECFGLYYVGSDPSKSASAIGLALSDGLNVRNWTRIDSNLVSFSESMLVDSNCH